MLKKDIGISKAFLNVILYLVLNKFEDLFFSKWKIKSGQNKKMVNVVVLFKMPHSDESCVKMWKFQRKAVRHFVSEDKTFSQQS